MDSNSMREIERMLKDGSLKFEKLGTSQKQIISLLLKDRVEQIKEDDKKGMVIKSMMIERVSESNGYCYVRLIHSLPALPGCRGSDLETGIINLCQNLGKNPTGADIITELSLLNTYLELGFDRTHALIASIDSSDSFVQSLMKSQARYFWDENSGIKHVRRSLPEGCDCSAVFCDHGWAARAVFCFMVAQDVRVGAEVDLADFFTNGLEDNEHEAETEPTLSTVIEEINEMEFDHGGRDNIGSRYSESMDQKNKHIEELNKKVDDLERSMRESRLRVMREVKGPEVEPLRPSDSASNSGRYKNHYLDEGTILTLAKGSRPVKSVITAIGPQEARCGEIVRGYVMTEPLAQRQKMEVDKIRPINGLANPFKSNRLNVLIHFHTAIDGLSGLYGSNSYVNSLKHLTKYKSRTPSEEMTKQIIARTFDMELMVVTNNSFNLPYLEIGMIVDNEMLTKCFDLLVLEYKMLWFDQMKSLRAPEFHRDYDTFNRRRSSQSGANQDKSQFQRPTRRKSSSKTKSLLGF